MKNYVILISLLFAMVANMINTLKAQPVDVNDSLALVDLYDSTNGSGWDDNTNWLTTNPVSTWEGIELTNTRVTRIDLYHNNLTGTLPSSIGNLKMLERLDLDFNQLSGAMPASIGNLINLERLYLDLNQLSGTIPASIGNLVNLLELGLSSNQLSGAIPASIGNLINLEILDFSTNQLSGSIPASISNLERLERLDLSSNQLSGAIPASIGNLINLESLLLSTNNLSGSIPSFVGNSINLTYLDLSNNQLTGEIPGSFNDYQNFYGFNVSHNKLTHTTNDGFPINNSIGNINISYNRFNFNGLESAIAKKIRFFRYTPQNTIVIHRTGNILSVTAGGTLSNNTYRWYKDGYLFTSIAEDSTFTVTVNGHYYVAVTNSLAINLTLYSNVATITDILPVSLLSFTGTLEANDAFLRWQTAQEYNASHFTILRSTDGIAFDAIAQIAAIGNSNNLNKYKYTDKDVDKLNTRKLYYRLEEVDKDNSKQLSNIVQIDLENLKKVFTVYPNPAKNIIHVQLDGTASITITNALGQVLLTKVITNNGDINIGSFASGVYYVQNQTTGETRKIVIAH
jgi:Leucine-rich repeat (LRR) protein